MRLSISNIAWEPADDKEVAGALKEFGLDAVDLAPGRYFSDPPAASVDDIRAVRRHWRNLGFEITGMQALLFGVADLNLFGTSDVQARMIDRLTAVCRIGEGLGARHLVFGSPRNRDRSGVPENDVIPAAVDFFRRLGDRAAAYGVTLCLEPNPPRYGANFMTTAGETEKVVRAVDHPSIAMQLDTGAIAINGEDVREVVRACADIIGHIHASEPDLLPVGDGGVDHAAMSASIAEKFPEKVVCIEMAKTTGEPPINAIRRAAEVAVRFYGAAGGRAVAQ